MSSPELLKGIRVLDLSMGWSGPLATRHLADMGAEVIKVESCTSLDWWRSWEITREWVDDHGAEKAVPFNTMNRNKLGITLDLMSAEGKSLCKKLVALADVVIANYSGTVLKKLGLDYPVLSEVKPELVMISMPAFGSTGPWKDYRAYGSTIEQASGLPHLHGEPNTSPTMIHVAYGDAVAGLNAVAALLVALRHKNKTGEGQFLDLSQAECLFPLAATGILEHAINGDEPLRYGNRSPAAAPHGVYPCRGEDRWITIQALTDIQWQSLVDLVGESLSSFGDLADRIARHDEIDQQIGDWTSHHDADDLMFMLQHAGIPAGVVKGVEELIDDQHLQSRKFWQFLHRDHVGDQPHPVAPYRSGSEPFTISEPAPTLGQHNKQVLMELLGLSATEVNELEINKIIGSHPLLPD